MTNHVALEPTASVVVEACAGSGKTWLLVSRIVRLLLAGAQPSEILAITFTRKASQEMQARLQLWLRELARGDEDSIRQFFAERGITQLSAEQVLRAKNLYHEVLLAQPGVTISTFHGWFMQVMQRAPLNADVMQGASLLDKAESTQEEAWEALLAQMLKQPNSQLAQQLRWLFLEQGLSNTRKLLLNFIAKRAEWWAYTSPHEGEAAVKFALAQLQSELSVDLDFDAIEDWGMCGNNEEALFAFTRLWAMNGTPVQQKKASELERAWTDTEEGLRFSVVWPLLFTQDNTPRKIAPTKNQNPDIFLGALKQLQATLQTARDVLVEQQAYRLNEAVLHCGATLLAQYQVLKANLQQMDFADIEWQLCRLLQHSEHAETMQYKLDSRYRHVLLDEFQDTNPLQWQILRAWFDASVAVDSQPTVFVVGDPKQSIYRFRRADARLFGVARDYLKAQFSAHTLQNNHTRRNSPAILTVVNAVFAPHPEGFVDFEMHTAEHQELAGMVLMMPLAFDEKVEAEADDTVLQLRNPLTTPRAELSESGRYKEAAEFAEMLLTVTQTWRVGSDQHLATYGDIMVLVRNRTHLQIYEEALRARHIPFVSSRRGGLLDTLEAQDIQALLTFLMTPFADLALAQVLRAPIFSCSDEDLMCLASEEGSSWWQRLLNLSAPSMALMRASKLLQQWLSWADKLPVHDLLDRVYFEGDVLQRYAAVLPLELRAKAIANLNAFMEIALSVDAGRYPSLPRFLQELREMRDSKDDAPNEGKLGTAGNAVRIYTVHESKGLEAPIVWLLDVHNEKKNKEGGDVLLDWPTHDARPRHFSIYAEVASRGKRRQPIFAQEEAQQAREEMNLLYVAMTRAQQALIVSGNSKRKEKSDESAPVEKPLSWYERIAAVVVHSDNPLCLSQPSPVLEQVPAEAIKRLSLPTPITMGSRASRLTAQQQEGIWLHSLLQHITENMNATQLALQQRLAIPAEAMSTLWVRAQSLIQQPALRRFFDAQHYLSADNEMSYVNVHGELKRIDRLVEFQDEVWVLDYKLGDSGEAARYRAQLLEYRAAIRSVYESKNVRCALLFGDGTFLEVT